MARWIVEVIPAAERELKALPDDLRGKFLHVAGLLEEFGPGRVGLPHVRPLERKLVGDALGRPGYHCESQLLRGQRPALGSGEGIREEVAEDAAS